ncbi:MAG: LysR family transcriptional regulator [Pseudomonadota bacterium]
MQQLDWTALAHLRAVGQAGSLGAAARLLGVDATTVARRVRALEQASGTALMLRGADGTARLTPLGEAVLARAEAMAAEADAVSALLGQARGRLAGTVRVTAVPILVNRLLVPALPGLLARHPGLTVELVPEARALSLTRREADLALRLARPVTGGSTVRVRRVAALPYGVYAADGRTDLPWIAYDAAMAHLPQAQWLSQAAARDGATGLVVSDAETALQAALAGLGRTLLPVAVAEGVPGLTRLPDPPDLPERPVWLLSHADQARNRVVQTVAEWLAKEALAACRVGTQPSNRSTSASQ